MIFMLGDLLPVVVSGHIAATMTARVHEFPDLAIRNVDCYVVDHTKLPVLVIDSISKAAMPRSSQ